MGVRWFHAVWGIGVLVAIMICMHRWDIEVANRKVAIVLDYSEVSHLAAVIGERLQNVLIAFQRAGVTGIAMPEMTLSELIASGRLTAVPPALWRALNPQLPRLVSGLPKHEYVALTSADAVLMRTLQRALRAKTGRHHALIPVGRHSALLILKASTLALWEEGLGLDRQLIALVRDANLMAVPRLANTIALNDEWLKYVAEQLQLANARLVIFDGEEVLGYRERINDVVEMLRSRNVTCGIIEFAKQRGERQLALLVDGAIVRVHSITSGEMAIKTPSEVISRFVRAVTERNVRVCYMHLPPYATADTMVAHLELVRRLKRRLEERGFVIGMPRPFDKPWSNRIVVTLLHIVLSAAALAGLIWLLNRMQPSDGSANLVLFATGAVVAIAICIGAPSLMRILVPLGTAIVFPALGLCVSPAWGEGQHWCISSSMAGNSGSRTRAAQLLSINGTALEGLITCSLITLSGAALIVGMLLDRRYMVQVLSFRGVKIAQLLPMLLVAWLLITGWNAFASDMSFHQRWRQARLRWRALISSPVLWSHALITLFVMVCAAYWMLRTGNISPEAVPEWELRIRELLEQVLIVRPRFKEAFLGHPALTVAFGLRAMGEGRWWLAVALLGFMGQLSMINTFMHIHTPLWVSVLRTIHGLWIGWLIGAVILSIIFVRAYRKR